MLTKAELEQFFAECTCCEEDSDGLGLDEVYGLYVSWCTLTGRVPASDRSFRAAVHHARVRTARHGRKQVCTGLAMAGPAATDYIVHSEVPWA